MLSDPTPTQFAKNLRQLADRFDDQGDKAIRRAAVLAARGWPVSTNGTDGGRSSDPTSSTERAALNPGPFDNIDFRMRSQMSALWAGIVLLHSSLDMVMAHATDDDPIPAGTGHCLRCEKFCRPDDKHPHNRITSGFCPACYQKWWRLRKPERSWFIRTSDEEPVA